MRLTLSWPSRTRTVNCPNSFTRRFVDKGEVVRGNDPDVAELHGVSVVLKKHRAGHGLLLPISDLLQIRSGAEAKRVERRPRLTKLSTILNLSPVEPHRDRAVLGDLS